MRLDRLPAHDEDGNLLVVVEAPRGAQVKFTFDPKLGVITLGRPLHLGLAYPYDWGFVPSTKADDGDPLDAMVLHDAESHPGVVIPCKPIGVVRLTQSEKGKRQHNDRVIAVPADAPRWATIRSARDLPARVREELSHFFLEVTAFTEKDARVVGFEGPRAAERLIRRASR